MSYLDEQRKQMRAKAEPNSLRSVGFLAILVCAVIVGFIGAQTFLGQPGIVGRLHEAILGTAQTAVTKQNIYITTSGKRIGRSEVAPAFRACFHTIRHIHDMGPNVEVDPQIFGILMGGFFNQPEGFVAIYGPLLMCALDHNPGAVCDPDNRAMVVDGVNRFMRAADSLLSGQGGNKRRSRSDDLSNGEVQSFLDRISMAVEKQARDGRLIKSDFGWFPAAGVTKIFEKTKPSRDACAAK